MGLNTALRISDLPRLKWDNVYNYTCRYQPISRTQAYRIVKTAAGKTVQDERDEIYLSLNYSTFYSAGQDFLRAT